MVGARLGVEMHLLGVVSPSVLLFLLQASECCCSCCKSLSVVVVAGLVRGGPLYLNQEHYQQLEYLWKSHLFTNEISNQVDDMDEDEDDGLFEWNL